MPYLNALQLYKFGPYQQPQQVQIYFHYQASIQIWITYSGGRTTLSNQNKTWILIPGQSGIFEMLRMTNFSEGYREILWS